jgi:hypothetical protein
MCEGNPEVRELCEQLLQPRCSGNLAGENYGGLLHCVRLLNGVGKPAESVFPWGMEHKLPHVITVKALCDVRFP